MDNVYQPIAYIQGNGMGWPDETKHGPLFTTYYLASKWVRKTKFGAAGYVTVKKMKVINEVKDEG